MIGVVIWTRVSNPDAVKIKVGTDCGQILLYLPSITVYKCCKLSEHCV